MRWVVALVGSYRATLDFGRETNTWMPPRWAATTRAVFSLGLEFSQGGVVAVSDVQPMRGLALGEGTTWCVREGRWRLDGDTLRLALRHEGFAVGDCVLDEGDLDLALPVFDTPTGILLSAKEGLMTIIAYRLLVRRERRIVGVWRMQEKD